MKYSKKIATLAAVFTVSASILASNVRAEDKYLLDSVYLKPEVGYVLPTEDELEDTVFLGGKVGYDLDSNWAIEAESGWMRYGLEDEGPLDLDVNTTVVLGNIRYGQRCDSDEIGWYTYAGAGWAQNHLQSNGQGVELQDATVWQVGFGTEIPVAKNLDVFLDVRYLGNVSTVYAPAGVDADDAELNSVIFAAGLKF